MNKLEAEVEEILRNLEREEGHFFEILSQHSLKGASGWWRKVDFVIKDFNKVKYLVECKDVHSLKPQTFRARMCGAYTELCDLLLKLNGNFNHPAVRGIVVVRDISYNIDEDYWCDEFDKQANLFHPIGTQLYVLGMFKDMGLYDILEGS